MGWMAVGSGLAVILLALPVAGLVTLCFSKARVRLLDCTDARVRLIAEVRQCSFQTAAFLMRIHVHSNSSTYQALPWEQAGS